MAILLQYNTEDSLTVALLQENTQIKQVILATKHCTDSVTVGLSPSDIQGVKPMGVTMSQKFW